MLFICNWFQKNKDKVKGAKYGQIFTGWDGWEKEGFFR
jgi:hypothetical protein